MRSALRGGRGFTHHYRRNLFVGLLVAFEERLSLGLLPLASCLSTKASRFVCSAAATKLGDSQSHQVSGNDWEVFRAEIVTYLAAKEANEGRLTDELKDGLWFLFAVARRRAAKARRRQNNGNIVAHRFFHSVGFPQFLFISGMRLCNLVEVFSPPVSWYHQTGSPAQSRPMHGSSRGDIPRSLEVPNLSQRRLSLA